MCDEWMPRLTLPLSSDAFRKLPRHPAYKYEYYQGAGQLTPRPRHAHLRLDLSRFLATKPEQTPPGTKLRQLREADFAELSALFAAAFAFQQPFGSLSDADRERAAQACLDKTRRGGDGPWLRSASFVATVEDELTGALFITLLPGGDPLDMDSYHWPTEVPESLWSTCPGQPHLTWVFVSPWQHGAGLATALLRRSAEVLHEQGHRELWSTFLVGNDTSMLWHWRRGFELLPRWWKK